MQNIASSFKCPPATSATAPSLAAINTSGVDGNSTSKPGAAALERYPHLLSLYRSITDTLNTNFSTEPPYTIQRLAELVLQPTRQYSFLPPYLAALDKVVSVASAVSNFPLPSTTSTTINGSENAQQKDVDADGDEGLGGALLTPIPWLQPSKGLGDSLVDSESSFSLDDYGTSLPKFESSDQSHGNEALQNQNTPRESGQSLRDSGAVTQGELLRLEQEAGVVPIGQEPLPKAEGQMLVSVEGNDISIDPDGSGTPEAPHARGPDEIGVKDVGPQKDGIINTEEIT